MNALATTFDKGDSFTIIKPINLKYIYLKSSYHIHADLPVDMVKVPKKLSLKYKMHVSFVKMKTGKYHVSSYAVSGLSPWSHFKNDESGLTPLCTTAVNLGTKIVDSEASLKSTVETLKDAAESCCMPDLKDLQTTLIQSEDNYDYVHNTYTYEDENLHQFLLLKKK